MKTIKYFGFLLAFALLSFQGISNVQEVSTATVVTAEGGYFDVYLKNNCSKEVKVTVKADGSSSTSTYKSGDKTKVPVKAGYEVSVDGKLLIKLAESDSGKEINLCK
ncbi:hypothetical protein [Flavobacterium sp.]|uniref:hypothetical protein n=1 Tax=Flavobacterium sp. TaxID=239 RepID=UPI0026174742|nr:hypothetical protein [Flavobacterium sp.]